MKLEFVKYQGTGNDFIMIDGIRHKDVLDRLNPELVKKLCDRRFGIGADGLIVLVPKEAKDFEMIYYNADGHQSSMCGNGGRCIVDFASKNAYIGDSCVFEAIDGTHLAQIDDLVSLKMIDVKDIKELAGGDYLLDTGSPHYVHVVESLELDDFVEQAKRIRNSEAFREKGVNVNFIQLMPDHIKVRTFERGVEDETLSCGTGVVASSLVAALLRPELGTAIRVNTRGGELSVRFVREGDQFREVYLQGPAKEVFRGVLEL